MNVLLPVLRRPTMASFMATSRGRPASSSAGARRCHAIEQLLLAAVLLGADGEQLAVAELEELGGVRLQFGCVALVGDADDRLVDAAQAVGDLLVERDQAGADVDDEQDDAPLRSMACRSAARRRR